MIDTENLQFIVQIDNLLENTLIVADELRVSRVLLNILTNAIKYRPAEGTITFSVAPTPSRKEGYIRYRYEVTDPGIGKSGGVLCSCIRALLKRKKHRQSVNRGAGFGFTITKNLVEVMGGTIVYRQ